MKRRAFLATVFAAPFAPAPPSKPAAFIPGSTRMPDGSAWIEFVLRDGSSRWIRLIWFLVPAPPARTVGRMSADALPRSERWPGRRCSFCRQLGHRIDQCRQPGAPAPKRPTVAPTTPVRHHHKYTVQAQQLRRLVRLEVVDQPANDDDALPAHPRTRGDCANVPRPCPFVSCSQHLYLDVTLAGNLTLNFPDIEPDEMVHSCALDLADEGGMTLEAVAQAVALTRERIRQIETKGLARIWDTGQVELLDD